jgi:peroxiredoxin
MRARGAWAVAALLAAPSLLTPSPGRAKDAGEMIDDGASWEAADVAGDFRLVDQNDAAHELAYYSDFKFVLLIARRNSCPESDAISPDLARRLSDLEKAGRVKTLLIDAEPSDSRAGVRERAAREGLPFPVLMDAERSIARSLGLVRAGQFVVLGMPNLQEAGRGEVSEARCLSSWLASDLRTPARCAPGPLARALRRARPFSRAESCDFPAPERGLTYTGRIAPILALNCLACHFDGAYADFSGYDKVYGWSAMIRQVLRTGLIHPSGRDPHYAGFVDDLTETDIGAIQDWIDSGSPRGKGKDLLESLAPRLARRKEDLRGTGRGAAPDLVFRQEREDVVPASGVVEYQYAQLAGPFAEDTYVRAIDVRVNERVVHHLNLFVMDRPLAQERRRTTYDGMQKVAKYRLLRKTRDSVGTVSFVEETIMLTGGRDGRAAMVLPPGLAYFIPKGSYLGVEYHYTPSGRVEENRATVGFSTYDPKRTDVGALRRVKRFCFFRSADGFELEPGQGPFEVKSSGTIDHDVTVLAFLMHCHYRCTSVKALAHLPDGGTEVLLSLPNNSMKFLQMQILSKGIFLPKGTRIEADFVYDNSKQNPNNPDPTVPVPLGSQTYTDEMYLPRIFFVDGRYDGGLLRRTRKEVIAEQIGAPEAQAR